jgi:predicted kinase
LTRNAQAVLANGHAVLADAVFDRLADRDRIEQTALDAGVPFMGFWLHARPDALFARVDARRGDASDATVEVVRAQLARDAGPVNWIGIETGGVVNDVVARVADALVRKASQVRGLSK